MHMRDQILDQERPSQILPLQTRDLVFEAKGNLIIDGINLDLDAGSLSVIMGPNGAGKSVLLRLLHGLIEPTSGTISYAAMPMSEAVRKRQALVFQRPVLLRRSVAENINFVLRLRGRQDTARCVVLLKRVGLLDYAKQPARLLSVGEQQRLALARALATDPDILFLDEPTASLDPASTDMIERIARDAHAAGTKIIFVTHDIAQARRLADNVVFLNRGRLMEFTAADSFFTNPASPAAQAYLDGRIIF
jgi:tungstate transport system ATP-binding protein